MLRLSQAGTGISGPCSEKSPEIRHHSGFRTFPVLPFARYASGFSINGIPFALSACEQIFLIWLMDTICFDMDMICFDVDGKHAEFSERAGDKPWMVSAPDTSHIYLTFFDICHILNT